MTKRDFETVAGAIRKIEACLPPEGDGAETLYLVTGALSDTFKEENPRFNAGVFYAAALPLRYSRLKEEILRTLNAGK